MACSTLVPAGAVTAVERVTVVAVLLTTWATVVPITTYVPVSIRRAEVTLMVVVAVAIAESVATGKGFSSSSGVLLIEYAGAAPVKTVVVTGAGAGAFVEVAPPFVV